MDPETLAALRGSIKKWRRIVNGSGRDEGISNCPLCQKFHHNDCCGCPVSTATGLVSCAGSPYDDWFEFAISVVKTDADRALAQAELDFLISLLPPGELP